MSIEIKSDILAKELNQGIVPLGVPKAYQYDAALVEAARAAVNQGLDDVAEAGATAVTSVKAQESTSTTNINTLGDKILAQMKHGYGYPFTAANAAAMTDTAKIYVYTGSETGYTNGNWYYWNGTAWTSGGVYNATALETDKTLMISGAAADAFAVSGYAANSRTLQPNFCNILGVMKNAYYNTTTKELDGYAHYIDIEIDCTPGDMYQYKAVKLGVIHKVIVFLDADGNVLEKIPKDNSVANGTVLKGVVITPAKAVKMHYGSYITYNQGRAIEYYLADYGANYFLKKYTGNKTFEYVSVNSYAQLMQNTFHAAYANNWEGEFRQNEYSSNINCILFEVSDGDSYIVSYYGTGIEVAQIDLLDENKKTVVAGGHLTGAYVYYSDKQIDIPYGMNIKYMCLSYIRSSSGLSVRKRQETSIKLANFWEHKKMNVLGDSKTHGDAAGKGTITPLSWPFYIPAFTGMDICRNYGISGTTISGTNSNAFVNRYGAMSDDADIVCVYGGVNDHARSMALGAYGDTEKTTFYGSLEILISGLIKKYPSAYLFFITPMKYWRSDSVNDDGHKLIDYVDAILKMCDKYSVPVLDFYKNGGITPYIEEQYSILMPDKLHESIAGYERTAHRIAGFIKSLC